MQINWQYYETFERESVPETARVSKLDMNVLHVLLMSRNTFHVGCWPIPLACEYQAFQIAIDHQYQVVQVFPRRDIDRAEHFRFIAFTVTDETPDFSTVVRLEPSVLKILGETGEIN